MYENFYGFKEKPFNLSPDPAYLYMSEEHENTFTHLEYALAENKGFVVITGEIGSGKTTLVNYLIDKIPQYFRVAVINNTRVTPRQLIKMICQEFEIEVTGLDKTELIERLNEFLLEQYAAGNRPLLIIDESQNLTHEALEEIRLLSNLETEKSHLIQMVLLGQPELMDKLKAEALVQFVQRVTVHCHLSGLKEEEVEEFIHHRLKVAGAEHLDIFESGAVDAIYKHSGGIPRIINSLCDKALVYGFADDRNHIDQELIENLAKENLLHKGLPQAKVLGATSSAPFETPAQTTSLGSTWDLPALTNRIALLEDKIDHWIERLEERDVLAVESLKVLKETLRERQALMTECLNMKYMLEGQKSEFGKRGRSSFWSRLIRGG